MSLNSVLPLILASPLRFSARGLVVGCLLGASLASSDAATDMPRPQPTPGGIDSRPAITRFSRTPTNVLLDFQGMQGFYEVQMTPRLPASNWTVLSRPVLEWPLHGASLAFSNQPSSAAFYRVCMTNNPFRGSLQCYGCHDEKVGGPVLALGTNGAGDRIIVTNGFTGWLGTAHATALNRLKDSNGVVSPYFMEHCAVCHTVGKGQGGFVDLASTPGLTDVGCESCHGASGQHARVSARRYHPVNTVAAEVCGGCHTDPHHPTYDEWKESHHAVVTADVAEGASGIINGGLVGDGRQMSCGPCHSGATRLAMLKNYDAMLLGVTNRLDLPTPNDGADFGVTCAVCHDPHADTQRAQLRNPVFSTQFYTFATGSDRRTNVSVDVFGITNSTVYYMNSVFATQYVAGVQICGQCHNTRGAVWTGTARPPHHSPQYNILVGAVQPGYLNGTVNYVGPHGLNTNGCAACHMEQVTPETISEQTPKYTGHKFEVGLGGCAVADCHVTTNIAAVLAGAIQMETTARIQEIVGLLGRWGTNNAPAVLRTNYGRYSWEFTSAGQLSNPSGTNTIPGTTNLIAGPSAARQALVPDAVKKARFNIYLIEHDGSKGVHNIDYTRFLLRDARTNVQSVLQ